jgi:thymidylate kinase
VLHFLFLIAAWFDALEASRLGRRQDRTQTIALVDGWYYRSIAKAVIRGGLPEQWVASLFATAPEPELVVLLDVAPSVAWERARSLKPSELGRWDGFVGEPRAAFCSYQSLVRAHLRGQAERLGWSIVRPTAEATVQDVSELVRAEIVRRLGAGSAPVQQGEPVGNRA